MCSLIVKDVLIHYSLTLPLDHWYSMFKILCHVTHEHWTVHNHSIYQPVIFILVDLLCIEPID